MTSVIASEAKQYSSPEELDCFVASAPRNDELPDRSELA
jgi:hypothetical protein